MNLQERLFEEPHGESWIILDNSQSKEEIGNILESAGFNSAGFSYLKPKEAAE